MDQLPGAALRRGESAAASSAPVAAARIELRRLRTQEEYAACVELQKEIWGPAFSELVPLTMLKVSQRIGGVTAGAFDADGRLLGFVFGITGVEDGRLVHWSDMLAVSEEARNLGLGRRLKEFQRELLLPLGVERAYWTFDPLVSRNAHLNLNRLGVRVIEYVPDMYGDTDSTLHRGLGTDRFIVVWEIASEANLTGPPAPRSGLSDTPIVNLAAGDGDRPAGMGPAPAAAPIVRIQIPADIQSVQRVSLEQAGRWRATTRRAFLWYLERGYRVAGFYRDGAAGPCYYTLSRADSPELEG
ncbi:MAG: hypothetical protein ACREKN_03530 [Longimicrobiaceae bacterium]